MTAFNPRSVTDAERPWLENWSDEAHELLFHEVRARRSNSLALSLVGYCSTRSKGLDAGVSGPVKAEYRKILAELADAGVTPPPLKGGRVAVTPSPYTHERGLGSVPVASAPVSASRRAASVASAPVPAAKNRRSKKDAGAVSVRVAIATGAGAIGLLISIHPAQADTPQPDQPPIMYGGSGYVDDERDDALAMAA